MVVPFVTAIELKIDKMPAADTFVVGLGTNQKWTSRLIRKAIKSEVSHGWIEYASPIGGMWVIHAQPDGIIKEPLLDVLFRYSPHKRFELCLPQPVITEAINNALSRIGTPYDYGVIRNGIKLWYWHRTGRYSEPVRNPRELHCIEFIVLVLQEAGVKDADMLDPELTHAGKLLNFITDHSQFREMSV